MYLQVSELWEECLVKSHLFLSHSDLEVLGHVVEVGESEEPPLHAGYHGCHLLHMTKILDKRFHVRWLVNKLVCCSLGEYYVGTLPLVY